MMQNFGQLYAPAYDLLYREKDYGAEVELLGRLFQRYGKGPVQSILDLGCGTGNHAIRLAAGGYRVIGVDRSAEMLTIADRKARDLEIDVRFHQADIQDTELGETFDAAIMMFAVLSYQQEDADITKLLRTARRHLRPNGLLLFDFWYGPAVLAQGPEERVRTIEEGANTWVRTSFGTLETERNLCHVAFHLRQLQADRILDEATERHTLRYLFSEEIARFLNASGYQFLRLGAFPEFDREPNHTTWNVMAVSVAV